MIALVDCDRGIFGYRLGVFSAYRDHAIVLNRLRVVVLDGRLHVLLGVNGDHLATLLILEADFIEVCGPAILRAARFDSGLSLLVGQRIRRHLIGVIHSSDDERPVRIAFKEVDDDFLANPWYYHPAPIL